MSIKVIKLGGSLMHNQADLVSCLDTIEQYIKGKIVIVPGGGEFADQVRYLQQQWKFDNKIAHQMAVLSMQKMALLFKSIKPCFGVAATVLAIKQTLKYHAKIIWSPDIQELESYNIKASWDITADSLAAWLAGKLITSELILVKSAPIPTKLDLIGMQQLGLLDAEFSQFSKNSSYKIKVINQVNFNEYFIN